ncbi:hypothetical protein CTI12_AA563200 [Artemisia annua]|uniref:Uncharacterized protein n=1 Tax=Artemisia annua TaxID=35608 RepID=A0A2U1KUG0_ARTAN|nr:hypothetical protein CTI12_AA563200 [Artemisia annua]
MPRTRSRATGTSSEMQNLNKYDDLLRCRTTTEEEEEEQQPQEVLKKRKEVVRLKEKAFAETMTDLPEERLKLLEDSPFYKLVEMMSGHVQNNKVIKKLASMFSTNNKSLSLLLDGTRCIVTPQDFTSITGVEDGDEDVIIRKNSKPEEEPEETKIFLTENGKVSNVNVLEQLTHTKDYDTLRRAFALLAMQKIICAPLNGTLGRSYLKYVRDVSLLRKKKWATHAIHLLVRSINTYKNGRGMTRSLGGCTVFLLLYVRKKISETIPDDELSDETRKKMIDVKLDELLETCNKHRTDFETARSVKNTMLQRNESMITALQKVNKKCVREVENKNAKALLKVDGERTILKFQNQLDARMADIDSILEREEARSEEENRRPTVISKKRKGVNEGKIYF